MPPAQGLEVEVVAGASFELLIGLSALTRADAAPAAGSAPLRRSLARVGPHSSELWLHLLGLALADPEDVVGAVRATGARELRRHLVGVHVPAWQAIVGVDALEATARGDARLLGHPRYYAGQARESLERLLPLGPAETKRRIVDALERYRAELLDRAVVTELERDAAARRSLAVGPEELIERATGGYRYEPEPECDTVVLVPHVALRPWLLLCQHERTRIICYPLPREEGLEELAVLLGQALGDDRRVRMLRRLAAGPATLTELAEASELAKSTAHHHLARLRAAGLVTLHGNARSYWFTLRADGLAEARRVLGELAAP